MKKKKKVIKESKIMKKFSESYERPENGKWVWKKRSSKWFKFLLQITFLFSKKINFPKNEYIARMNRTKINRSCY